MPKLTERTDRWVTFTEEEIIEILAEKAGVPSKDVSYITYPQETFWTYPNQKAIRLTLK